jgi:ribulose-phosphate 3-epimerase
MIEQPDRYVSEFQRAGADILSVQYEACTHLHRTLQQIKGLGMQAGVALNPHTPVFLLENIIREIDLLLIMSVNPGFGGQGFIPESYEKISEARELINRKSADTRISVDGGVDAVNAPALVRAGADVLVSGSFLFKADDFETAVLSMKYQ